MIDYIAIQKALYRWVRAQTTQDVIWENEDDPRPAAPYVGLLYTTTSRVGDDSIQAPNPITGGVGVVGDRDCHLEVECFGLGSYQTALTLESNLSLSGPLATLRAAGVIIVDMGDVLDSSIVLDSVIERRAGFSVAFRIVDTVAPANNIVGIISKVETVGTHDNMVGSDLINTITVSVL